MRILGAAALGLATATFGAQPGLAKEDPREFYDGLEYRNIGPYRGGRATAAAGVASDPLTYYMGATGGLFKTTNAGVSWFPVSDEDFGTGPVGSIDVAPSDPNVVVVGMGESPFRGVASSQGDGVYISTDAGESWTHAGLKDTRQISSVKIHPTNPDVIWVAAQGDSWSANPNRGVYKTTDGGRTWRRVLAGENDHTGAVDLEYDANNPRILYAAMWDHDREPWEIRSGGPGSGLWKSTDGGETWAELTEDLPKLKGKMGVAPSPAKPGRVWAVIEASEGDGEGGGLYRSEDYGESWTKVNSSREIQARSWYYMHIHADPKDADTVYIQNAPMKRSIDGGKSFTTIRGPHGDHHDLWINPLNPANMIDANDGGATVTFDGGQSWSTLHNQPTAQFYRVITDNTFPDYRLYAGQQDNSTVAIRSQAPDGRIGRDDYHSIGGGESAHVGFDPDNPRYVYAGSYLGTITEWDRDTNTTRDIRAYPELKFGVPAEERKHRWNWNAPIVVSHHDARVIYHAGERVFRSDDRGASWTAVSPDLTRAAPETLGKGGRPITNEVSENYATILYLAESPHDADVLWAGSDDGKLSVTQDGGENWTEITPPGIDDGMFNAIEPSPHNPGEAYVAFTRYKYSDRKPYVFKTSDFGRNWTALNTGLPKEAFVRVVREDPEHEGLLFAGTELGVYVSFDTGETWEAFKRNMPVVPVTDLRIQFDDLIVATQGRAFWILDDIGPLRQHHNDYADAEAALFKPSPSYILTSGGGGNGGQAPNPPSGAVMDYVVSEALNAALFPEPEAPTEDAANEETEEDADAGKPKTLTLEILNAEGEVLRTLKTDPKKGEEGGGSGSSFSLPAEVGINRIAWDRATDPLPKIEGLFAFPGGDDNMVDGYAVGPGTYTARLSVGEAVMGEETFEIRPDPRLEHDADAIAEQQRLVASAYAMVDELHTSVNSLRTANAQAQARVAAMTDAEDDDPVKAAAKALDQAIEDWEATVIAPEREFFQDVLNWGDKLASDLHVIYGTLDGARYGVTQGMRDRLKDVKAAFKSAMEARDSILDGPLADYSAAISDQPAVIVPAFVSD